MKNLIHIVSAFLFTFALTSCDHSENQVLPDFLDGTEYGVLLHVDVTSPTAISIADIGTASVSFDVSFDGDKRPVESIGVNKIFSGADGSTSAEIVHATLSQLPTSVSLTASDLVQDVPDLMSGNLQAGDKFAIKFTIKYVDGLVVTRFGTRLNPNFDITFE